jgi:hypothetical protein
MFSGFFYVFHINSSQFLVNILGLIRWPKSNFRFVVTKNTNVKNETLTGKGFQAQIWTPEIFKIT